MSKNLKTNKKILEMKKYKKKFNRTFGILGEQIHSESYNYQIWSKDEEEFFRENDVIDT